MILEPMEMEDTAQSQMSAGVSEQPEGERSAVRHLRPLLLNFPQTDAPGTFKGATTVQTSNGMRHPNVSPDRACSDKL